MKCKLHEISLKKGVMLHIEPLGDIHYGNLGCRLDKLEERIRAIAEDDSRYWIGMGDYIDNVRPYKPGAVDKRWTTEVLKGIPDWDEQIRGIVEFFKPISHKCLGLLWGNHEWSTMTSTEFEDRICKPLNVEFLGARAFIVLRIVDERKKVVGEYSVFAFHGSYMGMRVGGAINRLQDMARIYDADIYLMGHTHSKMYQPEHKVFVEFRRGKPVVVERPVIYGLTGGFLDPHVLNVDEYFDKHPLPRSVRIGTITVGIDPWKVKIHGFE